MEKIKLIMTAVYDNKVKQYMPPFTSRTIEEAIRSFGAAAAEEKHEFNKFSSDYSLFQLGFYYPETGIVESCERSQLALASDYTKN
jgi:hypothetical protein